jgi:hypothetical protein
METFNNFESSGEPIDSSALSVMGSSGAYTSKRQVSGRFALTEGAYVIVASCYESWEVGECLVRVFTETPLTRK